MRVLVTRPEPDARRTAAKLVAMRHEPLVVPLTVVKSLPFGWPDGPVDAIALTSANALIDLPPHRPSALADVPTFAVGARTAAAATACGFGDVRTADGDALALGAAIASALPARARVLYLAGVDRKSALEACVAAAGIELVVREAYAVVPVDGLPADFGEAVPHVDAAVHFSRRSAAIFCRLLVRSGFDRFVGEVAHHCISPDASEPLRWIGAHHIVISEAPNEAALLASLPLGHSPA